MKNFLFPCLLSLLAAFPAFSAPRLVVSTPSLLPESEIDVIFDQPMVEQEDLGNEVANDLFATRPELPGKLFWKAPTIAEFRSDSIPSLGTEYSFMMKIGLKHLDGSEVEAGPFATVSSEAFRVLTARIPNRWSSNYTRSTTSYLIVFNDDVDVAAIAGFFTYSSSKNGRVAPKVVHATAAQAGYYRTSYLPWKSRLDPEKHRESVDPETPVKNILIVSPVSPLPVAKSWALQVLKGLPNSDQSTTLGSDVSYTIGEVAPFRFGDAYAQVSPNSPRSILLSFNERLSAELDESAISISPAPEGMKVSTNGKNLRIEGDFNEYDKYTITLSNGINSSGGQSLSNPGSREIEFQRLDPELALPSEDEAQLAFGKREYEISTINLASVTIRIKKLEGKGAVRTFQGYRNYTGVGPNWTQIEPASVLPFSLVPGKTVLEKTIDLGTDVDTGTNLTLSWDDLLSEGTDFASLFIDVIGTPHPMAESNGRRNVQAIVQLTDIGLAWKFTNTKSLVYAFSCKTGKPLPGVKINVRGEDAELLEEAVTGDDGMVTVVRSGDVRHVQASLGEDSYTAAFDETLDSVGLWHFPVRYSWMKQQPQQRRAFMFTERSLYRPGEKVRIKGIVRNQFGNAIGLAEQKLARVVIVDPQDKEIFTEDVELSALGSFDLSYTLPDSKTGGHVIRLEFPEDIEAAEETEDWELQAALMDGAIFELPLRVEEFRRNTFEILQEINDPAIGATEISANLTATYYQGQPVAAGKASTFTEISEINLYPERYRDFLFGNHRKDDWRYWYHYFGYRDRDADNGVVGTSLDSESVLSAEGFTEIPVEIPQGDFPTARKVSIATEVTDANNQTLTARSTATVHPSSLYAGISRVDRLIRVGDQVPFSIVVTDTSGEPAAEDVNLTVTLSRQVHTNTKTTNANGDTVTESEPYEEEVSTAEVVVTSEDSGKEGLSLPIAPQNTGLHFLSVKGKDAEGREFATVTRIHVYGSTEYPWQYEDGLRIKLVSEKKSYKPGETARILVLSPIEGTALVTVEREKILSSKLIELKADNPVIEIPLTDEHAPNAYVSILIVKGSAESARDIKEPQLRLGYCELQVENLHDRLDVAIDDPSESSRPGTEVTLTGTVKTSDGSPAVGAEVTLYAVDEGTLAVMGYDTPDPMSYFYDRRYLSVDAGTSFHDFITENPEYRSFHNKGFFIGGGGDPSKLADLFRKNLDPCAEWSPTLMTDAEGRFSSSFTLPDTLTRYRVIAIVHHTGSSFGNDVSELLVKKPLMLEPKLPRFVHQGDLVTGNVMVQNASEYTATWEVVCSISGDEGSKPAELEGASTQSITLAPGDSEVLGFPFRVVDTGEVTISYRATPLSLHGGELTPKLKVSLSDAVQETFISHYPMPLLRQVTAVRTQPGKTTDLHDLLSEELQTAKGSVELELATSPLVEISASADYLLQYPYGCAEQTSSSLMPWFAVKDLRSYVPAFAKKSDKEVEKAINAGVGRLLSMQQPNGSFGYWPGATTTNEWVTPYAGMVLTLASQNGGNVPQSALDRLSQYLIGTLRGAGEEKNSTALENHARSLYTLALLGKAQEPYHSLMVEKLPYMSDTARALLAAAMAEGSEGRPQVLSTANGILSSKVSFKENADNNYWIPRGSSLPAVLIAQIAIDPDSKEVHATLDRLLNDRNPYGHWRSTWMNGWSMLAVAQYASHQTPDKADIEFTLNIDGESRKINLNPDSPTTALSFPLTAATTMTVSSEGASYIRMKIAGKPAITPLAPVAKNGLSIDRFYEKVLPSGQTEVLKQPALGDLIRVTLRVTLPKDDSRYVVVDDPLPSIFETVNTDFASQSGGQNVRTSENDWTVSHSELRSDRAVFFMDRVWRKGTYELTYLARCTIPGEVSVPPAKVESMYDPENYALSASAKFSSN
ncbi:MAG: alpha-2-macroglobulin family protein [Luteolibacter sp.]